MTRKKRNGIVSFYYKSLNYGGMLQAYALQKRVGELAQIEAEQIAFCVDDSNTKQGSLFLIAKHMLKKICFIFLNLKFIKKINKRRVLFSSFMDEISHTKAYSKTDINEVNNMFDTFICGSDQIWNPDWYDSAYFLDFVSGEKPKIAYAVSIGKSHLTSEQIDFMKPLINRLDYISVRENEAKKLIQPFVEKEVKIVLDPTLLLTKDEWNEVAIDVAINEPYIFVYLLGNSIENRKLIKKTSQILGYKIVAIPHVHLRYEKADIGFADIECNDVGPAEFVGLIKKAEMVITDSFHGCVFSIIYQKKFWAVKRHQDNEKGEMNSRLYSLFENLKVGDRILKEEDIEKTKLLEVIDYEVVQRSLQEKKNESLGFLKGALYSQTVGE